MTFLFDIPGDVCYSKRIKTPQKRTLSNPKENSTMNQTTGTEYHVSPSGSNRNPGTAAQPFATIQRAADVAMPGHGSHITEVEARNCDLSRIDGNEKSLRGGSCLGYRFITGL